MIDKGKDVVQSNYLVRATPSNDTNEFRLSTIQKRIIYYFIELIRENKFIEGKPNWLRLEVTDMAKRILPTIGGNEMLQVYEEIEKFYKSYEIQIRYRDDDGEVRRRDTRWILEIDRPIVASGYYDIHIPDFIKQQVVELDGYFTQLDMETAKKLKSYNQLKLWELLLSYNYDEKIWEVSISHLRELLEIKPDAYKKFVHFNKYVLKKCCDAINKDTDITVEYEVIRDGRKPKYILFKIKDKESNKTKTKSKSLRPEEQEDPIFERAKRINVSKATLSKYQKELTYQEIDDIINTVDNLPTKSKGGAFRNQCEEIIGQKNAIKVIEQEQEHKQEQREQNIAYAKEQGIPEQDLRDERLVYLHDPILPIQTNQNNDKFKSILDGGLKERKERRSKYGDMIMGSSFKKRNKENDPRKQ